MNFPKELSVSSIFRRLPPSPSAFRSNTTVVTLLARTVVVLLLLFQGCAGQYATEDNLPPDFLTQDSVVMITGAAGFLGSELAMALHRTYQPKKILCVDSMDKGFGTFGPVRTEQDLALFEFKRQRVFHLLQTLGDKAFFYRVDFRPFVPEYFDASEVPVLEHIFQQHPDVTHIVHLADHYHRGYLEEKLEHQAVARLKGQTKAGMMESLLEQIRLVQKDTGRKIHFTYASSYEVYNYANPTKNDPNPPPFTEDKPITTPSTRAGASKLIDEILARTYHETDSIYSVGLRFFCVYGPWGLPGSPMFEMAERTVLGESPLLDTDQLDDIRDFIYIDDAVDAMMSAMQFRPAVDNPEPVVFNVGSRQATTLRSIAIAMQQHFPGTEAIPEASGDPPTVAYANTARAQKVLGVTARVPLSEGIEKLLAWHYDRAFPYGGKMNEPGEKEPEIAKKGIVGCSRYDAECLRGTPVFPCASECSHSAQCTPSFYDDVIKYTRALTADCEVVMYTVALDHNLSMIPSAVNQVSTQSEPFVGGDGYCNLAFVSDSSPLVRRLRRSDESDPDDQVVLMHGFWAVVPVVITQFAAEKEHVLRLLPKLSPGNFFSATTNRAIYCDPDVIFDSIPKLLEEASMQPYKEGVQGATAMLIGKGVSPTKFPATRSAFSKKDTIQDHAYRLIRIAVIEEMAGDGFGQKIDSSFIVHALNHEDSRLFRCDALGEVVQWDVQSDQSALEFILGLHDMWSRVIARKAGFDPWWIGDDVVTVPADEEPEPPRRRLQEIDAEDGEMKEEEDPGQLQNGFGAQDAGSGTDVEEGEALKEKLAQLEERGDDAVVEDEEEEEEDVEADDFADSGDDGDSEEEEEGDTEDEEEEEEEEEPLLHHSAPEDPGSYDIWMGILSSSDVRFFSRIVPLETVGAVHVDDYANPTDEL